MRKLASYGAVLVLVSVLLTGCATMMTEKTQKVDFKTKPDGAEVVVGAKTCTTPCTMVVDKGKWKPIVTFTKDGYQTQSITLESQIEPTTWLNVLNLGFGYIVDWATGTIIKYDPEYYAILSKK